MDPENYLQSLPLIRLLRAKLQVMLEIHDQKFFSVI